MGDRQAVRASRLRGATIGILAAFGGAVVGTMMLNSRAETPPPSPVNAAEATAPSPTITPALPFDIGGHFKLNDQNGRTRTPGDFDGQPIFLFFGYANCEAICTTGLPRIATCRESASGLGN
ncbi:MAG: SCO family protein, partial [Pseudomonadota bacterium]